MTQPKKKVSTAPTVQYFAAVLRLLRVQAGLTPDDATLAYLEGQGKSMLLSKPDEVGVLARRYAMIRSQALGPEESVHFIEQLMGEL
ncbi:Scr1 family TA system antitoxin-like transcriptional regulator [Streptomyces sp. NPDC005962]|uniref:Scr1 family TA system antitoxin-like transcriptional regulator n=1 Tax=Streptomyces sp. NPDC005962 TaxID=3154466 RepID=UPI0033EC3459